MVVETDTEMMTEQSRAIAFVLLRFCYMIGYLEQSEKKRTQYLLTYISLRHVTMQPIRFYSKVSGSKFQQDLFPGNLYGFTVPIKCANSCDFGIS